MTGRGRPKIHETPRKKVTLLLEPKIVHRAKVQAAVDERSLSSIVEEALTEHLDKLESEK